MCFIFPIFCLITLIGIALFSIGEKKDNANKTKRRLKQK